MSRLYIIVAFVFISLFSFGQNDLSNYLKFAEAQYQKGDYVYALEYYQKALALDSQTVNILWNYAETLRAYKDYRKAEFYYEKVYAKEDAMLFPASLMQLGLMQKQNGKYDLAIETFKKAKKKYAKDKKGYLYLKSKRELESCLWAKTAVKDSTEYVINQLPTTVNSPNSEFGHNIYNGKLFFSSLRGDSIHSNEEVYSTEYKTRLYVSKYENQNYAKNEIIKDLVVDKFNTGNGAFSLDGNRFYFSLCKDEGYNYKCKIMVANYKDGKWSSVDTLGAIINQPGSNTSMPSIGKIDGEEVLFFSSDRSGGEGGMDIYYSIIKNGNQFGKVQVYKVGNSPDNELSPFYDDKNANLYFSSSWHDGFGGYDVFSAKFVNGKFEKPVNLGLPTNSPANDTYFFIHGDTNFVSSNRLGVLYSKNPTCCSDIFSLSKPIKTVLPTPKETLSELNKRLPVTLYFHNDWPDPKTLATTTKISYIDNYHDYVALIPTYKKEYSTGLTGVRAADAQEDIESFFTEYVDQGVKDLELFRDLMLEELKKGTSLELTIKGFASPLAKTEYNVNLTKRRIASLVNYLSEYEKGIFKPFLNGNASNGAKISIKEVPFGEYTADKLVSDNPNDQKNSVYSRAASLERKIEIQSISILSLDSINVLKANVQMQDLGKINANAIQIRLFKVKNTSDKVIHFAASEIPCTCNKVEIAKNTLNLGEITDVKVSFDPKGYSGKVVKSIYLQTQESTLKTRLVLTAEIL
jgi:tetratricopeptide (TPR) repeat protein